MEELYILTNITNNLLIDEIPDTSNTSITYQDTDHIFDTLFDSGALQGNYVRSDKIKNLIAAGIKVEGCNVEVCGAFSDKCQVSNKFVVVDICVNADAVLNLNATSVILPLKFTILDHLPFDMIVGRRDMIKYNLFDIVIMTDKTAVACKPTTIPTSITAVKSHTDLPTNKSKRVTSKGKAPLSPLHVRADSSLKSSKIVLPWGKIVDSNVRVVVQEEASSSLSPYKGQTQLTRNVEAKSKVKNRKIQNRVTLNVEISPAQVETLSAQVRPEVIASISTPRLATEIGSMLDETSVRQVKITSASENDTKFGGSLDVIQPSTKSRSHFKDLGGSVYLPWDTSPLIYSDPKPNILNTYYGAYPPIVPRAEYVVFLQRKDIESPSLQGFKVCDEPKDTDELPCGQCSTEEECDMETCYATTSEQLFTLGLKNQSTAVKSTRHPTSLNRAHISEFFHYEENAAGIDTTGSDLPSYQWDWDASEITQISRSGNNVKNQGLSKKRKQQLSSNSVSQTSYIPTQIYGDPELVQGIKDVCNKYLSVFNTCLSPEPALLPPMELDVDLEKWRRNANKGPPRQQTQTKQDEVHKQISKMLPTKVVSTSQAEYYSQVHLTPKPVHSVTETSTSDLQIHSAVQIALGWRFCVDFRNLNMASTGMGWPIPNIQQMLQRLGSHKPKIFGKLDLTSGYHQAPLSVASRVFTAFITFMGVYEWNRVPMGLKGAPSYFQGVVASVVLLGLIYRTCELYVDDLIIHANNNKDFCKRLDEVLARFHKHRIRVNPDKCSFGLTEVEYVGHTINAQGLSFSREKIAKVLQIDTLVLGLLYTSSII